MITILLAFCAALLLSLLLTPLARKAGELFGFLDMPSERKVHTHPIPRTGGVAIFISFVLALIIVYVADTDISRLLVLNQQRALLMIGCVICFLTGLADDFWRLPARRKLLLQILGVTVAYAGGIDITRMVVGNVDISFGIMSYVLTVLWFLLFINAVNLVDGLDGLAGGVTFFAAMMMVTLSFLGDRYMTAVLFAALSGGILGFLRYNFNPASIFLGDGGSYFIGYAIAGMSIMGGVKSQTTAAMLIPLLALGLPVFDTILSSLRRFAVGKKIFGADKGHIHHRLLSLVQNTRQAVLLMYAMTIGLCMISLLLVTARDERAAFLLILVGVGAIYFAKKLGYFSYMNQKRIISWINDVTDETGISRERRNFLNLQIDISQSNTLEELWKNIIQVLDLLHFDCGMMYLNFWQPLSEEMEKTCMPEAGVNNFRRTTPMTMASICLREKPPEFKWMREVLAFINPENVCSRSLFRIELPLELTGSEITYGCLVLIKDNRLGDLSNYSLKRVEHLRREVIAVLERINADRRASDA